jgi:predicted DNA-binding antitoxin AbrB/MazE fold protein
VGTIEAIFEDGVFRPIEPVVLPEKCRVRFQPQLVDGEIQQDLDAIYAAMDLRFNSGEHDVAARHDEHQP